MYYSSHHRTYPSARSHIDTYHYPLSYQRPIRWRGGDLFISALFMMFMLGLFAGLSYVLIVTFGFDDLAQLTSMDVLTERFNIGPAPRL